ncbi:MAG: peptide chain release factor N(5)-glutamine methyltransferase [Firmicutes bacterium]|nr:peptide chain release factor N(5)-glutamine methyltransferase [Bacillota bacterium]HXL03213.1 peptide chain release factor N(5)-glutamine methyltransferase [Bacillota bacterium]
MAEPIGIVTARDALSAATRRLGEAGIPSARLDAEVLLMHVLGIKREHLYAHPERRLDFSEYERYQAVLERRLTRLPVAYITGKKEFMSLEFIVDEHVLIPRPETEILVEEVTSRLKISPHKARPAIVADIGTGSGAIAVSIAWFLKTVKVIATDISADALTIARQNSEKHQVDHRVEFLQGDLVSPLAGRGLEHKLAAIVSNPPYLSRRAMAVVPPEVAKEPKSALFGGEQGLDFSFTILEDSRRYLTPGGFVALEAGYGQAKILAEFAKDVLGYDEVGIVLDLAGIERVVIAS